MKLDPPTIAALAEHLESCQLQARDTSKITDEYPHMDWDDAYAIQAPGGPEGRPYLTRQDETNGRRDAGVRLHDRRLRRA
jgi:2-keto-4-pentenoate hydratase